MFGPFAVVAQIHAAARLQHHAIARHLRYHLEAPQVRISLQNHLLNLTGQDVTACLFSHVQQEGYTLEQLGECVRAKLAWRIRLPETADQDFDKITINGTQRRIKQACDNLAAMLIAKNQAYGDSALHPMGVFAKGSAVDGIKVRIDDKLNRIKNKPDAFGEDPVNDLLGYLILLQLAMEDEKEARHA